MIKCPCNFNCNPLLYFYFYCSCILNYNQQISCVIGPIKASPLPKDNFGGMQCNIKDHDYILMQLCHTVLHLSGPFVTHQLGGGGKVLFLKCPHLHLTTDFIKNAMCCKKFGKILHFNFF